MVEASSTPGLSPRFCFNTGALQDFLRLSRATIDDSINQHLNALITPSQRGFDPASTSSRQTSTSAPRQQIDPTRCRAFREDMLFRSWQARSNVLEYCAHVARAEDPDDPEAVQRQMEAAKDKARVVDERVDPYSARYFPREARTEVLDGVVRNEVGVEAIVRRRSWEIVGRRCGGVGEGWEEAFERWRRRER